MSQADDTPPPESVAAQPASEEAPAKPKRKRKSRKTKKEDKPRQNSYQVSAVSNQLFA